MKVVWDIHNAVTPPRTDYEKLKRKINKTTIGYGAVLTSSYFITHGISEGVSAALGVATSIAYISLLEKHVDNIENNVFQKQLLAPIGVAVFETTWNHAPFSFDFDYGTTFIGFLAYKVALLNVLYEEVLKMIIDKPLDPLDSTFESKE